jgi:transcriptional regulator with XRE-family HTH domain
MSWIRKYSEERSTRDQEFKAGYEEESAILALIRARNERGLSQQQLAEALGVSQPYIAQIERRTKPMSASLLFRYAQAVGAKIEITTSLIAS